MYSDYWNAVGGMLLYPNSASESRIVEEAPFEGGKGFVGKVGLVSVLDGEGRLKKDFGEEILGMVK